MTNKACFAACALLGIVLAGCQSPYSRDCAGGCCGGSCGVGTPTGAGYAPAAQTYTPISQPPSYQTPAYGSGSR